MKVSGMSRYLLPPPVVFADIHYTPADHTNLNKATPLVNNQRATRIAYREGEADG